MKQYDENFGLLNLVRHHTQEFSLKNKNKISLKRKIKNEIECIRTTVLLCFEGGYKYYAPVNFLSRISGFFNILLNNPIIKNKHYFVDLRHTDCKMFYDILTLSSMIEEEKNISHVRYFETGDLLEILNIASFYQITIVMKPLTEILFERVNDENICYIYEFFKHRIPEISNKLEKIISIRMEVLIKNASAFMYLKQDSFLYFIFNPKTIIPLYTELFLLRLYIKIGQSKKRDVREIVNEQKKILNNSEGCYKIHDVRLPNKVYLTIGGYCPIICPKVMVYNPSTQEWLHAPEEMCKDIPKLFYHKTILHKRDVYIIGGCAENNIALDTLSKWNLDNFKMTPLPRMHYRRNFLSAGLYDDENIYALGGFNGRQRLKKMNFSRSDGASVVNEKQIYAIGGYNGQFIQNSMEYYDQEKNKWFIFCNSMNQNRRGLSAVTRYNCIYVAGGFNTKRLNSVEMLDIREGKWHLLSPMFKARSNFTMSIFEDDIEVFGGCDQMSRIISDCEKYNIVAGKWESLPSLKYHLSAHSNVILEYDTAIYSLLNYDI
uniref:BACK domain-containing protein n=1 Tax=Strongyloides stercoralis TaxID=6248 RepID=A0AAF5D0X8_STRER